MRGRRHVGTLIALVADRGSVAAGSRPTLLDALLLDFLIDLVIYFACVGTGQSRPVIRSLGPAFLFHFCECLLGLASTIRRSSGQVIVSHVDRLFSHPLNPRELSIVARSQQTPPGAIVQSRSDNERGVRIVHLAHQLSAGPLFSTL